MQSFVVVLYFLQDKARLLVQAGKNYLRMAKADFNFWPLPSPECWDCCSCGSFCAWQADTVSTEPPLYPETHCFNNPLSTSYL